MSPDAKEVTYNDYYDSLAAIRRQPAAAGEGAWAEELLNAERSAATSGEVISLICPVLERMLADPIADRVGIRGRRAGSTANRT